MKIKPIKVTRTLIYSTDEYKGWCFDEGIEPKQEGFREFISDWIYEDFNLTAEDFLDVTVEESED